MAEITYVQKFCAGMGEDKAAYLQRIEAALRERNSTRDKALLVACRSIAKIWNKFDGMENPFTVEAPGTMSTTREEIETGIILMAAGIKAKAIHLDKLAANPDEALKKHGASAAVAAKVKTMVKSGEEKATQDVLRTVRALFKDTSDIDLQHYGLNAEAPEKSILAELGKDFDEFKKITKPILYPEEPKKNRR